MYSGHVSRDFKTEYAVMLRIAERTYEKGECNLETIYVDSSGKRIGGTAQPGN
jgi:hypothetical protein